MHHTQLHYGMNIAEFEVWITPPVKRWRVAPCNDTAVGTFHCRSVPMLSSSKVKSASNYGGNPVPVLRVEAKWLVSKIKINYILKNSCLSNTINLPLCVVGPLIGSWVDMLRIVSSSTENFVHNISLKKGEISCKIRYFHRSSEFRFLETGLINQWPNF